MLERLPDAEAAQCSDPTGRCDRLVDGLDDEATNAVGNDFRHGAIAESNHRRAGGHRLDHHQAKGLGPVNREQQRQGMPEEVALGALVDLADELDQGMVEQRRDDLVVVGLIGRINLGSDLQRNASLNGDLDRTIRSLFRGNAAQEGKILPADLVEGTDAWR